VDELNGEIQVRSQPGQFTEFRVILPPEPPEMMKGPSHEPA
jgi:signal transduction histidine kinase